MVWKFRGRSLRQLIYRLPLRTLLTIPFIMQLTVVTTLIAGLSFQSGKEAVDALVKQMGQQASDRIAQTLETELEGPHAAYQIIQGAIDTDQIDVNNFDQLQCYLQRLVKQDNGVDYLLFGRPTGEVLAVQKLHNGETVVKVREGSIPERKTYVLDEQCDRGQYLGSNPYDTRNRPWYHRAVEVRKPTWGPVAISEDAGSANYFLYASPVTPIVRPNGEIIGVLGAEIPLTRVNSILRKLQISKSGLAFIVDDGGRLMATSTTDLLYRVQGSKPQLILARKSPNQLIKATSEYLLNRFSSWQNLRSRKQLVFKFNRQTHLVHISPLEDNHGLNWLVVVVIPVADFMGPIDANLRHTLILCLLALLVAVIIGIFTAQRLILPIQQLNESAKAVAQGNWDQKVTLRRFDELRELADSFNRMAQQLKISFRNLESKNKELERMNRLKDQFLASTSYELKTPLNGMIGLAESLLEDARNELSKPTQFHLSLMVSTGHRLMNLVNNVLDLSQLKYHQLELNLQSVELRAIAEVSLTQCQSLIGHKDLTIINQIPHDLPLVYADENRLQQIFYQLLDNAIKFTESGTITLSAVQQNQELAVTISDTGIGIPDNKLRQIFQAFQQTDEGRGQVYGGLGLGLALTKDLVELHGGTLQVKSTLGLGSQLTFSLPLASDISLHPQNHHTTNQLKPTLAIQHTILPSDQMDSHGKFKILLVDDELMNLKIYSTYLNLGDYYVIESQSGEEVIRLLKEGLNPDLIVLDMIMPRMTGYEVTRQIRQTKSPTELPIILLSTKHQIADLVMGLELGANDYLTKPVSKDELLARIKMHLNLKSLKVENLRLATEVEITSKLQQMLLPKPHDLKNIDDLEVVGFMEAANEVGGDYYDVFAQNQRLIVTIGDVTGHGLESGVLAIMVQTAIRCLIYSQCEDIKDFFDILNQTLWENIQRMNSDKHLTLAILEYHQGKLKLSGQHESIILVRSTGEVDCVDTLDLGFPIGLDTEVMDFFQQVELDLNPGDIVVLYTDGITEAENSEKIHYGIDRLCEVIKGDRHHSAEHIKTAIIQDVKDHIGRQKMYDDITLVVMKREYPSRGEALAKKNLDFTDSLKRKCCAPNHNCD